MRIRIAILAVVIFVVSLDAFSQQFVFPDQPGWNKVEEGKPLTFTLALKEPIPGVRFSVDAGADYGMSIDSVGQFTWTPHYDLVDRISKQKDISVLFQANWKVANEDKKLRTPVTFTVFHVNRPPVA